MSLLEWDQSIKIGDYVFRKDSGNDKIYRVVNIERRFITRDDLKSARDVDHPWNGAQIGEEYDPLVHIQLAATLEYTSTPNKKIRKNGRHLDGACLIKVRPQVLTDHINRLNDLVLELFS